METTRRLRKYSGISLGAVLVMAFVLVQPTIQRAYAVGVEGLPAFDDCVDLRIPEDPISMNTVRSGNIVKTIHAEKEIFFCFLEQGELPVTVDVTTYIEIYENIVDREVIETNAIATTCLKDGPTSSSTATVIDCESYDIPSTPVPVGSDCFDISGEFTHPQEMNTVNKGKIAKTIEAQKEIFECGLAEQEVCEGQIQGCFNVFKKVEIILFTDIYEDLSTQEVEEVQFHSMRCVVLLTDEEEFEPDNDRRDATVETCQFSSIEN